MNRIIQKLSVIVTLLTASWQLQAQTLNVSVVNTGNNKIQIKGTATAPGFTSASGSNIWGSMSLTWRIPKTAAQPPLTAAPPAPTAEVTSESTGFTGAAPRNAFDPYGMDISVFDLTAFGEPDDGYWYFQVNGTTQAAQDIPAGSSVVLYEFALPSAYTCPGCIQLLTTDVPELLNYGISTTSNVYNAGMGVDGTDVLNVVMNNAPLPVRFVNFDARRQNDNVDLTWRVAEEVNVKGYYVERSANGTNWTSIGYVKVKPSGLYNDYRFTDQSPLANMNFYRISEEDVDGRKTYSVVRLVKMLNKVFTARLYAVPARTILTMKLETTADEMVQVRVTDIQGRTVLQQQLQLRSGINTQTLPVNQLSNGTYIIQLIGTESRWTGKFIKE